MKPSRLLLYVLLACALLAPAHGQVGVMLTVKRRHYLRHEPVIGTVTLTNTSGRDLTLEDTPELQWFGFQINGPGNNIIPPRNPNYGLDPIELRAGETVKKSVNINELYSLGDPGPLKIRATIYLAGTKRYYVSPLVQIEITEGRQLTRQAAGVPEGLTNGGDTHMFTLLTDYHEEKRILYVRIESQSDGRVFGTYPLGRLIDGAPVQAEFDTGNNFHILHLTGRQAWVLTKIGVNGEFMGQTNYSAPKTRPTLRRLADGRLQIVGGQKEAPIAQQVTPTEPPAKLSDRPPGLPR